MSAQRFEIRRLEASNVTRLLAFLESDPGANLFHLANLAQMGIDHPDLRFYGAIRTTGELVGVLMLCRSNAGIHWSDPRVICSFAHKLLEEKVTGLSGPKEQVEPLLGHLPAESISRLMPAMLARVSSTSLVSWGPVGERMASWDDITLLTELYARNLLFSSSDRAGHELRLRDILAMGGAVAFVERDGMAVSAARTSAIGHGMAMIGGVITLPEYRRRGFARACTGLLSRSLLQRGIVPHLLYDPSDPAASQTYRSLGYQTIDEWWIVFLAH